MATESKFDVNSVASISMLVALAGFVSFVLLTAPALVGAFISELQLTPQQAGYLISADMAGMGVATIPALFWLDRISWRKVAFAALLLNAVCHIVTIVVDGYSTLLMVRFAAGFFAGSAMSVCLASVGLTQHKDRNFGFWVVGQLILGAFGLAVIPHILPLWGLKSIFIFIAACVVILSFFVNLLPQGSPQGASSNSEHSGLDQRSLMLAVLGIGAVFAFYVSLSGVWAYLERVGDAAGISPEAIGAYLSIATLAGIAGALSASFVGDRYGRKLPVLVGFGIIFLALFMLLGALPEFRYFAAASLFKYSWTFILPFILAGLSSLDASGRVIVITNIFIGGGLAVGPALAAEIIGGSGYAAVIWFGLAGMLASLVFSVPLISRVPPLAAAG